MDNCMNVKTSNMIQNIQELKRYVEMRKTNPEGRYRLVLSVLFGGMIAALN